MSDNAGILIIGKSNKQLSQKAEKYRLEIKESEDYSIPWKKTIIAHADVKIPWDLVTVGWAFLNRWDLAVPLWRYGVVAADVGDKKERELTRGIVRDLRVLLYYHELIFIRQSENAGKFIKKWVSEMENGPDRRLAFLRAYYQVKPILCPLPIAWASDVRSNIVYHHKNRNPRIGRLKRSKMISLEISPGRTIKVHEKDVEKVMVQHGLK